MARYANKTIVPMIRSKQQIEKALRDFGIEEMFWGTSPRGDGIGFKYKGRIYRRNVTMPARDNYSTQSKYEQAVRQRWRIMYMSLKMKLEEIEEGGISFEDQFLSMMALPDGSTVADFMALPMNVNLLETAKMPKLLTGGD
jgi:hypothetical protein